MADPRIDYLNERHLALLKQALALSKENEAFREENEKIKVWLKNSHAALKKLKEKK